MTGSSVVIDADGFKRRFWAKVLLPDENGCMLWTASRDREGYGCYGNSLAHRYSLIFAEGMPAEKTLHAAHSCRNRHCVAPNHLRWATALENQRDRLRDGTAMRGNMNRTAKLTPDQVREIRTAGKAGTETRRSIAGRYGVTPALISAIIVGRYWKHVQ